MSAVLDFLTVFAHSDVSEPSPVWWHWINAQCSHALIGAAFGAFAPRVWCLVFLGWIVKEGFGDIPNGDCAEIVIADSLADLFAGFLAT